VAGYLIRYATKPASTWQVETVDSTGFWLTSPCVDLDLGGHPHISYYDRGTWNLKYATRFGPTWRLETVGGMGNNDLCGRHTFLALTAAGRPRIAYYHAGGQNLKFARYPGATLLVPSEYPTIQAAIDSAYVGDTIILEPITYTGPGNKDLDFRGKDIYLMSDLGDYKATIDCEGSGRGFYFHSGETYLAVVDRIAVHNGAGNNGAGLACVNASPSIMNCSFLGNSATGAGGGMHFSGPTSAMVTNCWVSSNTAASGGAVHFLGSSPILIQCVFSGNSATLTGGGISCIDFASPVLDSCVFGGNSAGTVGGGICCTDNSSPILTTCSIESNSSIDGGGMYLANACSSIIGGCTFVDNSASGLGGALRCESYSEPFLDKTILAFSTDGEAISSDGTGTAILQCCDVYGNEGGPGDAGPQIGMSGNFAEDPMFCSRYWSDHHLRYCSPCLDAPGCGHIGAWGPGDYVRTWNVPGDAPTIQAGIDSALCGDTVMVAPGTYHEHDIVMKSGIILRSETGEPDCVTIDADSLGRVLSCTNIMDTTLIKGFTITGGHANGYPLYNHGGGIFIDGALPCFTITDCAILDNAAQHHGGGIYMEEFSGTLNRCEISGNWAWGDGGGLYFIYDQTTVRKCIISKNQAFQFGGGILFEDISTTRVESCTVFGNSAELGGGGVYCNFPINPELHNTIIAFCVSGIGGAVSDSYNTITASCCDIYGNVGGPGDAAGWIGSDGNFAADPAFCDTANNDFHLNDYSPCADTLGCGLVGADTVGCGQSNITEETQAIPVALHLGAARPNPFGATTEISYGIPGGPRSSRVVISIYGALGRRVRTLVDAERTPGMYTAAWDGKDSRGVKVASGVYFYRISWNGSSQTRRMVLLK
jgi:predicted outer membrane repeat protein